MFAHAAILIGGRTRARVIDDGVLGFRKTDRGAVSIVPSAAAGHECAQHGFVAVVATYFGEDVPV